MVKSDIASQWRVLSGENDWDGLLQPLNLDLRRYIIHYGQRAGSVGDLYNQNKHGEFPKEKFFAEAGLEKGNDFKYSVTHYIHAGSDIVEPSWFGFVAVTTDEGKAVLGRRDILIAWRGTIHYTEWINDLIADPKSASELFGIGTEAKVHSGFLSLYTGTRSNSAVDNLSARDQVRDALRELMDKYKDEEISITVTGFSLGGALATLNAMDIVANGYNKPSSTLLGANNPCMVTTFTFGSPQVGDSGFKQLFKKLVDHHHLRLLRIRNANDPVHKWPFCTLTHVGKKLTVYSNESPYLKYKWFLGRTLECTYNPPPNDYHPNIVTEEEIIANRGLLINWVADSVSAHNMDVYLHGIAGVKEGTSGFHLEVDLDIALVNKYLDRLKDEYKIPDHWWEGENRKRMVQEDNGHWKDKKIESTGDSATTLTDQTMCDCSSNPKDGSVAENFVDHQIQTPNQLNKEEMHRSPLAGSIHSLSAKRQQLLLDTTNSPRHALFVTPSLKQSGSFLSQGSIKQGGSVPSVLKSNIKLKILECTPLASAFNDGILKSKIRLSDSLSSRASACSFSKIMEPSEDFQCQQVTAPAINLKEQLSGVGLKQGEIDGPVTPKNFSYLSQDGGTTELLEDKEHYEKYAERMGKTTAFNSLPMGITLEIGKDKRDLDTAYKLVSPLMNRSKEKLCSSTEHHSSLSGNLKPHDQDNSIIIVSREEPNSLETVPSSNYLTATAENRTQSSLPLIKANHLTGTSIVKKLNEGESNGLDMLNASENSRNFPEGFTLKLQSRSPEKNIETAIEITQFSGSFIQEQIKVSSSYASPDAPRSKNDQLPLKSPCRKKQTQSPTSKEPSCRPYRKEMHRGLCGDNMQLPVAKDVLSLSCHSTIQTIDNHLQRPVQDPSPDQDTQNSSKRKRISEVVLADLHPADKNKCIQQSPNFREIGEKNKEHMLEYSNGSNIGNKGIEGGKTLMNMTDISSKLSADTKQLLSPSFDKLNIKVINMLEDILLHQQKVNKLEMLCSEIQSKLGPAYGQSCNIQYKSVAETRLLLYRLIYEKAILQLMQVKRERLLNQVQLLRTGVRESQMLKLNYVKHPSVSAGRDTQLDNNTCSVRSGENLEGTNDKVRTMKHEADALEKKINNLTKSLCPHFKIKGELSCADTIDLLNDHLKKRTCWGYIRQYMQLWEVDVLQNRNGYHNVILNYHEFLSQSLTLDTSPNSSIFVGNKLNDINISKNFPNMDACSAFAFVFNHEYTKKYVGPKCLAQETQRTSSLLRNLLDVIEEVQIARLEIRGLILTSFRSPSAKQLDLQLAFIDFESGVKLIMSLDLTCLNCGVYPSEILPHHFQTSTTRTDDLQSPLSIEIKAAISNLRAGYSRIIRLCRCVTQVLQSSGR